MILNLIFALLLLGSAIQQLIRGDCGNIGVHLTRKQHPFIFWILLGAQALMILVLFQVAFHNAS